MNTILAISLSLLAAGTEDRPRVAVVVGAPGTPEYAAEFRRWADQWQAAARKAGAESIRIGQDEEAGATDRELLRAALAESAADGREPLWIVLIGHGTFDGREAKFNLRGPDVTDVELADWLAPLKRPVVLLNCGSGSGTFINRLSGENRVVVTATKSGHELNYARFGEYLAGTDLDAQPVRLQPCDLRGAELGEHLLAPLAQQFAYHDPLFRCTAQRNSITSSSM